MIVWTSSHAHFLKVKMHFTFFLVGRLRDDRPHQLHGSVLENARRFARYGVPVAPDYVSKRCACVLVRACSVADDGNGVEPTW